MNADEYCGFHTLYYFIIAGIGTIFIFLGKRLPVYDEVTAEIVKPYSPPFIILGIILIVLSFIGLIFFSEDKEYK